MTKLIDWTCPKCGHKNAGAQHFQVVLCAGCKVLILVTDRPEHIRMMQEGRHGKP